MNSSCCKFLTCDVNICRDTASYITGTESFGNGLPNRIDETIQNNTTSDLPKKCSQIREPVLYFKFFKNNMLDVIYIYSI